MFSNLSFEDKTEMICLVKHFILCNESSFFSLQRNQILINFFMISLSNEENEFTLNLLKYIYFLYLKISEKSSKIIFRNLIQSSSIISIINQCIHSENNDLTIVADYLLKKFNK